ncbi:MAG: nascent polypeptide-associated complex protein [Ignisphaera sp.]|uniref:Nascent polypeptide-associated complex protein n=2 Tax=Ignisphaera aggregans TaxID=334771 RepID=A0A7J3MYI1_9CREN
MLPMNPRELQKQLRQLKKLGIKIDQLVDAEEVHIVLSDRKLILEKPDVFIVEFSGQKMFYLAAQNIREELRKDQQITSIPTQVEISNDDIQFVAEYTHVSVEKARDAILKAGGDIAKAIELIESEKKSSHTT